MRASIVADVIYILSFILILHKIYIIKKNNKTMGGIPWIVFSIVAITCYQTSFASIINLFRVPVNIYTVALGNFILLAILYIVNRGKEKQKYEYRVYDFVMLFLAVVVVAYFAKVHTGGINLSINYITTDSAMHYAMAKNIVTNMTVEQHFHAGLFNAVLMELALPFIFKGLLYKIFVLGDLFNLLISIMMFYSVIRRYIKNKTSVFLAFIVTLLYVAAYPLNSILFGFIYLTTALNIILGLIFITEQYIPDGINKKYTLFILNIFCLSLFVSYSLFVPVVFIALFIFIGINIINEKRDVAKRILIEESAIFLIPCIMGVIYVYFGVFKDGLTVSNVLAAPGSIYQSLFINFLLPAPLALSALFLTLKDRKKLFGNLFLLIGSLFYLIMFFAVLMNKASFYYFYKIPYMLWVIYMAKAFEGISDCIGKSSKLAYSYMLTWFLIIAVGVLGVETKINNRNSNLDQEDMSSKVASIYVFNKGYIKSLGFDKRYLQLCEKASYYENKVAVLSQYSISYWLEDLSDSLNDAYFFDDKVRLLKGDSKGYINWLNKSNAEYVLITNASDNLIYNDKKNFFDSFKIVYENSAGKIVKVDKKAK